MAYSNQIAETTFTTIKLIEHAFRRCKVKPEAITSDMLEVAKDCLQLMLQAAVNESWPLWTQERHLLPIQVGQSYVETPPGTVDVLNVGLRQAQRANGESQFASEEITPVENAFDDDFETALAQTLTSQTVGVEYASPTTIVTYGILPRASGDWTWSIQFSDDGGSYSPLATYNETVVDNQWMWFDLEASLPHQFVRLVSSGGTVFQLREVYFATQCTEIPLPRINLDQYAWMPDRQRRGRPVQFFYDRKVDVPLIRMWPVPDETVKNYHLAVWLRRYIMDVGTYAQEIEVPKAMYEAFVWNLAWRLCCAIPEIDASKLQYLKPTADEAWKMARVEGRDRSPIMFQPNIRAYTR